MKRFLALLLALIMILSLSACGGTGDTEQTPPDTSDEAAAGEEREPVTIEFWHAMSDHEPVLQELTDQFNEQSDWITVNLVFQGGYRDLFEKLTASAVAGQLPALSMIYSNRLTAHIMNGLAEDLTPYIERDFSEEELNDIPEVFRLDGIWDDKYYALPFNKSAYVLYYNETMLSENNIDVPTTWGELREAAEKLTSNDVYGFGLENSWGIDFSYWVEQAGGTLINEATGELHFNESEAIEAVEFVTGMFKDGIARTAGDDNRIAFPFARGEVAMFIATTARIPMVEENAGDDLKWMTAPLPRGKEEAGLFVGTNVCMFNTITQDEKEAAWEYLKFITDTENTVFWAENTGYVPVRTSAVNSDRFQQYMQENPAYASGVKQLPIGFQDPRVLDAYSIHSNMAKELDEIVAGRKTAQEAMDDAVEATKSDLEEALRSFGQ